MVLSLAHLKNPAYANENPWDIEAREKAAAAAAAAARPNQLLAAGIHVDQHKRVFVGHNIVVTTGFVAAVIGRVYYLSALLELHLEFTQVKLAASTIQTRVMVGQEIVPPAAAVSAPPPSSASLGHRPLLRGAFAALLSHQLLDSCAASPSPPLAAILFCVAIVNLPQPRVQAISLFQLRGGKYQRLPSRSISEAQPSGALP
mmetsp:Transcript_20510/g.38255  ORF Transcript_20510/g.38255 Transcript_20510/m.38255 type:complete len:202 (-) Transcript_20510:281-886(-)